MIIDFAKLNPDNSSDTVIHPREIFNMLTEKSDKYDGYLRDVQTEVLNAWFEKRETKDKILKMNTGSGKTVVGLLILKSCLNEGHGPAVYVVPDSYLITQVENEANDLGIETTTDARSIRYLKGHAILVINVHKLINGQSVFGVGSEGVKIDICSLVIDDAHACISKIEEQFTFNIPKKTKTYKDLLKLFYYDLKKQSECLLYDLEADKPYVNVLLPFWPWHSNSSQVIKIISDSDDLGNEHLFKWPLVKNHIKYCDCVFHTEGIELSLRCLPINILPSYENAKRRIIMSATLPDDSELITHLDIKEDDIKTSITPSTASDIGDRMILIPQEINAKITENEIKAFLHQLSKENNVVVIVPSSYRAQYWKDVAKNIIFAENIEQGVDKLKKQHVGLVVFVNKYDGIDLPKDACRILVIDGLPDARNEIDKIDVNLLGNNRFSLIRKIQKIEQGMGRGIRSNEDYCVVFLMGASLTNILYTKNAIEYFTPATLAQIKLSEKLSEQIRGKKLSDFAEVINHSLTRNKEWIKANKSVLLHTKYTNNELNVMAKYLKKAFDFAETRNFKSAIDVLQSGIYEITEKPLRGLMLYYHAFFTNFIDENQSQVILKSALINNSKLPFPIQGIEYQRLEETKIEQAKQCSINFNIYKANLNFLLLELNSVLNDLIFLSNTSDPFEEAIKKLAFFLGFNAQRPEKEFNQKGPDDLWEAGNLEYFVIECKNGVVSDSINKHDCNQMNGSIIWFQNKYDATCKCYPILIHPVNVFEYECSPHQDIRIMTDDGLSKLKSNVQNFITAVVQGELINDSSEIYKLLVAYKLNKSEFIKNYTVKYKIKNK